MPSAPQRLNTVERHRWEGAGLLSRMVRTLQQHELDRDCVLQHVGSM